MIQPISNIFILANLIVNYTGDNIVLNIMITGIPMVPISWTEMQCPKTFNKELRKVAKIIPENISVE